MANDNPDDNDKKSGGIGGVARNTGRAIGNLGEKAVDTGLAIGKGTLNTGWAIGKGTIGTGIDLGGRAVGFAVGTVGKGVDLLGSALAPAGLSRTEDRAAPGEQVPGIEGMAEINVPPEPGAIAISYLDYSADQIQAGEVDDLEAFLAEERPEWSATRWINVSGLHPFVVNKFREKFGFHTLTAEDTLHVPQRPRVEMFDDHAFVVGRMVQRLKSDPTDPNSEDGLDTEQVSLFVYRDTLITFQQKPGDVWEPIRERLKVENSRIRRLGTGYLLYALLDAVVDHSFPVLEKYGDILEELEIITLETPTPHVLHKIHSVKRELSLLRRIVWPLREVVDGLYREEAGIVGEETKPYLRDVYEHTIQIVEIIESYREMASGLADLYMSAVSNKMNEIMKVLTIMASVFIPLTFVAGVYGMNFQHMPELAVEWAYPAVWVTFIVLTVGMLGFFKYKGWIGDD